MGWKKLLVFYSQWHQTALGRNPLPCQRHHKKQWNVHVYPGVSKSLKITVYKMFESAVTLRCSKTLSYWADQEVGQQYGEDSTTFLFFAQVSESANQLKAVGPQLFDMALLPRQIDHIWKRRSHDFGILENFTWRRCDLRKLSKAFSVSQRASSLGQAKRNEAVTSMRYASEKNPVLYFDLI